MKILVLSLFVISVLFSAVTHAQKNPDCLLALTLNSDLSTSRQVTETYLRLFRQLALIKNSLSLADLELLRNQIVPVNPVSFVENSLTSTERFSFQRGFDRLLTKAELLDWPKIKNEFEIILKEKLSGDEARQVAKSETQNVWFSIIKKSATQTSDNSTVVASVVLPDETLVTVTKEDFFPGDIEKFWLTNFSTGARTELFDAETGEGGITHLVLKDGSALISFTDGIHLALFKVGVDHQIAKVGEKSLFEVNQSLSRRYKLLSMRESENGDANLLLVAHDGALSSFQEISLPKNKLRHLTPFNTSQVGITYLLTDNGELLESHMSGRNVTFRNLSEDASPVTVTMPDGYSLFPSRSIKPSPAELFMRYISPAQKMGWYDVKRNLFTPDEELSSDTILHVVQIENSYSMDAVIRFKKVEVFHLGQAKKLYSVPKGFESTRAKIIRTKAGVSYLAIGSYSKTIVSELPQLILVNLDTMEEQIVALPSAIPAQFEDIFETESGRLMVLFDTRRGLEHVQIYGPLN